MSLRPRGAAGVPGGRRRRDRTVLLCPPLSSEGWVDRTSTWLVTLRLTGGGARVLSLADRRDHGLRGGDAGALRRAGGRPPAFAPQNRLTPAPAAWWDAGRWSGGRGAAGAQDLLTEATLPLEERGTQRRYTELARFNVFLRRPAVHAPRPRRVEAAGDVEGTYLILCGSRPATTRKATRTWPTPARARGWCTAGPWPAFPLPTLRYVVGSSGERAVPVAHQRPLLLVLRPRTRHLAAGQPLAFSWSETPAPRPTGWRSKPRTAPRS